MKTRKAKLGDLGALYKIGNSTTELRTSDGELPMELQDIKAAIKSSKGIFLVVEDKGQIIAFSYAAIEGETYGCIVYDVVIPAYRGRGIGKALLIQSERWLKSKGLKSVYGLATNRKMVQILEHFGYKKGKKLTWLGKKLG